MKSLLRWVQTDRQNQTNNYPSATGTDALRNEQKVATTKPSPLSLFRRRLILRVALLVRLFLLYGTFYRDGRAAHCRRPRPGSPLDG